jgi:DNA repair exonuclease SbcCD ATPase subunit
MKINRLSLQNFKGIRDLTITFADKTNIYGNNGTGKTTIYDAWLWLLFDKDHNNRKDFEIKPIQQNGEPVHNVETSVEASLIIDGAEYAFKKVFKEKWTKKRGSAQQEFTGHTVNYHINGVPKKKTEYTTAINNITKEDIFKILSNPLYFNEQLGWQERRSTLLKISGLSKTDVDFAQDSPEFSALVDVFKKYTPDDYKKMLMSERKRINDEIKSIPVRIDELTKSVFDLPNTDLSGLFEQLKTLKKQRADLQSQPAINPLDAEIQKLQEIVKQKEQDRERRIRELRLSTEDLQVLQTKLTGIESSIKYMDDKINNLRKQWFEENNKTYIADNNCPCCGQPLPEDKIKEAQEQFNLQKAERLKSITEEGKRLSEQIQDMKKRQTELQEKIQKAEAVQKQIEEIKNKETEEIAQMSALEQQKAESKANQQVNTNDAKIEALTAQIEAIEKDIAKIKAADNVKKRIAELEQQEKEYARLFAENEDKLNLLEKFTSWKIGLIEQSINSKFKLVKFKLFNTQINGGIEETCETTIDGVPYRNLNHGKQINAGLDIIRTLQDFFKVEVPIFIDNRESITAIEDMNGTQIINLIVSENDKKLRIEEN